MSIEQTYIIVGGYPPKGKDQHPGGQVTATRLLAEYANLNGIKLHIIDTSQQHFPIPPFKVRLNKAKNRVLEVRKVCKEKNISGIIIFSASGFSFYEKVLMAWVAKQQNTPSLLFVRSGHFIDLNKRNKMLRILNKVLLKIPTLIAGQGSKWVQFYTDMGVTPSKVHLIPNWIKIESNVMKQEKSSKVIFFFAGWMVEKKGVLELFDVIEEHYEEFKNYIFRFAGEGTLFEELKERKKNKNLKNIDLLGWVDQEDMKDKYMNADVFVLPSHAEGFPNSVLEAIHYRLPVISTDVGGIADSVINDYNGFIFEPKDKNSLYHAIKKLGASEALRLEFSRNSENILREKHDFSNNCKKVFTLFNNINGVNNE